MTDDFDRPIPPEPETTEVDEETPRTEPTPATVSTGIAWGAILILLVIAAVVVFAVQNTDPVPVTFLWMDGEFSLAIVILITVGIAIVMTELAALGYRKSRRRRRAEKQELRKLRGNS